MKTLAQMTEKERAECCGMWVNTPRGYGILLNNLSPRGYYEPVVVVPNCFIVFDGRWDWDAFDLLPHLPRAWNPDGTPPKGQWSYANDALGEFGNIPEDEVQEFLDDNDPSFERRWVGEWEGMQ